MNKIDGRFYTHTLFVKDYANTGLPENPATGDSYIISNVQSGAMAEHKNSIALYNGTDWEFFKPSIGAVIFITSNDKVNWGGCFQSVTWNGETFIFNESLTPYADIPNVKMFVDSSGDTLPATANVGATFFNPTNKKLYTATAENTWDSGSSIDYTMNCPFLVKDKGIVYTMWQGIMYTRPLTRGAIFYYLPDKCLYTYTQDYEFVKVAPPADLDVSASSTIKPVSAVVAGILTINSYSSTTDTGIKPVGYCTMFNSGSIITITQPTELNGASEGNSIIREPAVGERFAVLGTNKIYIKPATGWYTEENSETVPDGGMFLNKNDGYVYVYDAAAGTFSKTGKDYVPVEITETHVLTAEEVTAKSFTLTNAVKTGEETNILCFVQGIAQAAGVAFSVSGSTFGWENKTLDGHLITGDVFIVHYIKE